MTGVEKDTGPQASEDLRELELFRAFPAEHLDRVFAVMRPRPLAARSTIIAGRDLRGVGVVWRGVFTAYLSVPPGPRAFIREFRRGEMMGLGPALAGETFGEYLRAISVAGGLVLDIETADFEELVRSAPAFAICAVRLLASLATDYATRSYELKVLSVRDRVVAEVLRLCRNGKFEGRRCIVRSAPTHHDLSERIGASREAVTRVIAQLSADGTFSFKSRLIEVDDVPRLLDMYQAATGRRMYEIPNGAG